MGYHTIVVGTDGSPTATMARDAAVRLAKRLRARIVLVTAYSPPKMSRQMAERLLRHAHEAVTRNGVEALGEMEQREPAELILDAALRHGAELIVVGNKGIGEATRFRLGSVPDRVAHSASCDVLIVDTTKFGEREARTGGLYKRILAGTDGSPTATEAARKAMELAMQVRAEVTLLYVGDPIVGAIVLEETAAGRPEGVHVDPFVTQGDPSAKLCEVAESADIDLIVVGNKGMSGARRFLLGSVPNKVAHDASTDVLIVKTVDRTVEEIQPGHGAVVDVAGKKLAVYRDESGMVRALSPKCSHMGCTVDWNDADRTWDCPCHGSRYGLDGEVLRGPAAKPLVMQVLGRKDEAPRPQERGAASGGVAASGRIVIVGASLAGATAAVTLRDEGFEGTVLLIGAEEHMPYERPPLSKSFLRGETPFEDAMVRTPGFYGEQAIETRLGKTATGVDADRKVVTLDDGEEVPYDNLLVTTGARNRTFPIPGIELEGIYGLRTVDDARRIQAEIAPGRRALMGGMGFIGSEVAASLRVRGVEVTAVDGGKVPLQRVLGEEIGAVLAAIHADHGVRMIREDRIAAFEGSGRVERVLTAGGESLECDFVVLGLGVEPVTEFLAGSGVEIDNGVLVDELCRTNVEGIFAAGDVANHRHLILGRIRVEHWQNAIKHGRAAALSMMGKGAPYRDVYWFWSDQYDQNLQYAGFAMTWDQLVIRGSLEARDFTAFYLKGGQVIAAVALNRGDDIEPARELIASAAKVDPELLRLDKVRTDAPPSRDR
jgi:3-phenylpropionate/trans-cinnamate dioxygenase ferredoxin reductase subunit